MGFFAWLGVVRRALWGPSQKKHNCQPLGLEFKVVLGEVSQAQHNHHYPHTKKDRYRYKRAHSERLCCLVYFRISMQTHRAARNPPHGYPVYFASLHSLARVGISPGLRKHNKPPLHDDSQDCPHALVRHIVPTHTPLGNPFSLLAVGPNAASPSQMTFRDCLRSPSCSLPRASMHDSFSCGFPRRERWENLGTRAWQVGG